MSSEQVQIMRAVIEGFNRRDAAELGTRFAPDAEIVPVRAALEGTTFRGPDAAADYCEAIDESWDDLTWEVEELQAAGDAVIALGWIRGRGRDTGAAIDAKAGWIARFDGRLITNFHTYADRAEAVAQFQGL